MIAKHVMNIHMNRPNLDANGVDENVGEIDINTMKRYIAYCKAYEVKLAGVAQCAHPLANV